MDELLGLSMSLPVHSLMFLFHFLLVRLGTGGGPVVLVLEDILARSVSFQNLGCLSLFSVRASPSP